MADVAHRPAGADALAEHLAGAVGRTVVDHQHLVVGARHRLIDLVQEKSQIFRFIPAGNDDRNHAVVQNS